MPYAPGNTLKNITRENAAFLAITAACLLCVSVFLVWYFSYYANPYMQHEITDLSAGWQYSTGDAPLRDLPTLRTGPKLQAGETLALYRRLEAPPPPGAALLVRANHQSVNVYLDGSPLHIDPPVEAGANPGMALHFIALPEGCRGGTLKVELTSPYALYSGRTSPILLGTIPSLEAYTLSASMRSVILMAMCLLMGLGLLALAVTQTLSGSFTPQTLCLGVFAVIWALYYVCAEYIVFQFFTPVLVSGLSLALYFTFQAPLTLFFYFSFQHYKKWMLPAVILHCGFAAMAIALQLAGLMDLPRLVNANNLLLAGLAYTIVLAVLEALKKNRMMLLTVPFFIVAYGSMLWNFYVFYGRSGVVPYSYRDTYFLLVLCILLVNVHQFFHRYFHSLRETELLAIRNRQAAESYREIQEHLHQVGWLKHEIKNHISALRIYLKDGRYKEAETYLERYAGQAMPVAETVYHENFLLNTIVSVLRQKAEKLGVSLDLNLKAAPDHIADHDFYSLLSNILDNALEACAAMPEGSERFIRLTIARREPYLNIRCENSKAGTIASIDDIIQSTKTESGHGYGLRTIERIVDAYDGIMNIDHNENTFIVTVALKDQ
ncbi:MAG: GHKL domain-containing protein [Deltaproteobacteria bacterium]|jgi:signal transduction histidine kinase|nr:GHKL domain-containing protein [Deltaproteobacteria bacterium]